MTSKLTPQELARLEDFLRPPRIAVVATVGRGAMPQLTPNWYNFVDGKLHVSITTERVKYRNLVRDSQMSVCPTFPISTLQGWPQSATELPNGAE